MSASKKRSKSKMEGGDLAVMFFVVGVLAVINNAFTHVGAAAPVPPAPAAVYVVKDANTVLVPGRKDPLVLAGTRAPTLRQSYGLQAAQDLKAMVSSAHHLRVVFAPAAPAGARRGVLVGYLYDGTTNLSLALVAHGDAAVLAQGSSSAQLKALRAAQMLAQRRRAGMWGSCPTPAQTPLDPPSGVNRV